MITMGEGCGEKGTCPRYNLLVCDEDLECGDEVGHGDRLVALPLLVVVDVVDKDDEVLLLALVVDLDLSSFSLSHVGRFVLDLCRKKVVWWIRAATDCALGIKVVEFECRSVVGIVVVDIVRICG